MKKLIKGNYLLFIFLSGVLFISVGLYNGYPLLCSDSSGYIYHAFSNNLHLSRSIVYGIFIKHISLKESLWLVILGQGILFAYVLSRFIIFFSSFKDISHQLLVFVFLVFLQEFHGIVARL